MIINLQQHPRRTSQEESKPQKKSTGAHHNDTRHEVIVRETLKTGKRQPTPRHGSRETGGSKKLMRERDHDNQLQLATSTRKSRDLFLLLFSANIAFQNKHTFNTSCENLQQLQSCRTSCILLLSDEFRGLTIYTRPIKTRRTKEPRDCAAGRGRAPAPTSPRDRHQHDAPESSMDSSIDSSVVHRFIHRFIHPTGI